MLRNVLVVGGTGTMGAPVVARLAGEPDTRVTVLTRDTSSDRALDLVALAPERVSLVEGNLNDVASLGYAMSGVDEVFCNTDFFSTQSALSEYEQGTAVLGAAQAANVDKFVWSSLDNAVTLTDGRIPVPHYDAKAAVESYIGLRRSEEMMRRDAHGWYSAHVAVLVTAPYYENLQSGMAPTPGILPDGREGMTFGIPLRAGRYPMIGLEDIAWFGSHMLTNWHRWAGRTLRVVGDSLSGKEIASTFERVSGVPATYQDVSLAAIEQAVPGVGHDLAAMFEFFVDYDVFTRARDIESLRILHPDLMSFEAWLRFTGWDGA